MINQPTLKDVWVHASDIMPVSGKLTYIPLADYLELCPGPVKFLLIEHPAQHLVDVNRRVEVTMPNGRDLAFQGKTLECLEFGTKDKAQKWVISINAEIRQHLAAKALQKLKTP